MPPMAWGALSLAIVSFLFIGLGVLFTPIPGVGALFSFAAPLLALAGIILGGRAVTKSKAAVSAGPGGAVAVPAGGAGSGLALAAVIASALAFVPAVITALTCGACNALCATGGIQTRQNFGTGMGTGTGTIDPFDLLGRGGRRGSLFDGDAGVVVPDGPAPDAAAADAPAPAAPGALPPPPLAPGPAP
jgi:hypothetical protein